MKRSTLTMVGWLLLAAFTGELAAQNDHYPAGTVPRWLERDSLVALRRSLMDSDWVSARRHYFGKSYTPDLADIVIYIDTCGNVHQALTRRNKVIESRVLRGQKYVYALVFAEDSLHPDSAPERRQSSSFVAPSDSSKKADTTRARVRPVFVFRSANGDSIRLVGEEPPAAAKKPARGYIRVRRTSLGYQTDPLLTRLVNAVLAKLFFAPSASPPPAADGDSASRLPLDSLWSEDHKVKVLYVGLARMQVPENTWSRITVEADSGWVLPGNARQIVTNFANTERSPLAVGIGGLLTLHARTLSGDSVVGQHTALNIYLLGHWHLFRRPDLPARKFSAGPVVGVSPSGGDLLHTWFVGVSLDRLLGSDAGIVVGFSGLPSKDRTGRETRLWRWSFGLGFPL